MGFQHVETDTTSGVNVWVVDGCCEANFRWLKGITFRNTNFEFEQPTAVRSAFYPNDGRFELVQCVLVAAAPARDACEMRTWVS